MQPPKSIHSKPAASARSPAATLSAVTLRRQRRGGLKGGAHRDGVQRRTAALEQLGRPRPPFLFDPNDSPAGQRRRSVARSNVDAASPNLALAKGRYIVSKPVEIGGLAALGGSKALLFPTGIGAGHGAAAALAPLRDLLGADPHFDDPRQTQEAGTVAALGEHCAPAPTPDRS